ncbi:MAG: zinc-ribbon domain-containing protein [Planctomycetota bacterium]|nr:zinc-ribbon domain-containing protein [Planctomycetota bacterium]
MAKIIRCPNCGENVEVPPNPTGQIVTCVACGTAMRLKSKKDAGEQKPGDSSHGSLSGTLSGSMSATRITSDAVQASGDDPPDLGSTCDVCGKSVEASELLEDRGKLACRDCLKGARSSRPRPLKGASDDALISFSSAPNMGPRRAGLFTFGMPFFAGCAALAIYVACSVLLQFNPKPQGTVGKVDPTNPPKSVETKWDETNLPVVVKMMEEANLLKADQSRLSDARQRYEAVVAYARGQEIGSQEMRRLVDLAEQEAEALRVAAVPASPPQEPVAVKPPSEGPPETVPVQGNSVFDDPEVQITEKLNSAVTSLETALSAAREAADPPAQDAMLKFSEARTLLIKAKRNVPEDPGWSLSYHGTAVGFLLTRNYPRALEYLDRLPAPPDRAANINRVVCLLHMRENKAEAVTLLINHLNSAEHADDGYALNLLGTTLARYGDDVIKQDESLTAARETYDALVKKQAAKHPGEKRWGARWIGLNEWNAKDKERRIQQNKIEDLTKGLIKVQSRLVRAKKLAESPTATPAHRATFMTEQGEEQQLLAKIEAERVKIPPEEWLTPEQIVPVLPDVTAVNSGSRPAATTGAAAATQPVTGG